MIEQPDPLSLTRQCQLLGLRRAAFYYRPVEVSAEELELIALIDRQYLRTPFYGSRRMRAWPFDRFPRDARLFASSRS
jgi:putative transposase